MLEWLLAAYLVALVLCGMSCLAGLAIMVWRDDPFARVPSRMVRVGVSVGLALLGGIPVIFLCEFLIQTIRP